MAGKPDIKRGNLVRFDDSIFDRRLPKPTWISGEVMRVFQNRSLRWRVEIAEDGGSTTHEVDIEFAKIQKVNPDVQ